MSQAAFVGSLFLALVTDGLGIDPPALIVYEARGGWERLVVGALAAARLPIVVTNPRQACDSARGTGRLAKTDRLMPRPPTRR
jgi:transposase